VAKLRKVAQDLTTSFGVLYFGVELNPEDRSGRVGHRFDGASSGMSERAPARRQFHDRVVMAGPNLESKRQTLEQGMVASIDRQIDATELGSGRMLDPASEMAPQKLVSHTDSQDRKWSLVDPIGDPPEPAVFSFHGQGSPRKYDSVRIQIFQGSAVG
jgi:hypothetical protein